MHSISAFLGMPESADVWQKNAYVSQIEGLCYEIHVFFGYSLGKV